MNISKNMKRTMNRVINFDGPRTPDKAGRPAKNPNNSVPAVKGGMNRDNGANAGTLGARQTIFMHSYGEGMNTTRNKPE